jgi:hypothetical protein
MTDLNGNLELIVIEPEDLIVVDDPEVIDLMYLGCPDYQSFETEVIRLTNKERQERAIHPLTRNEYLNQSALIHTLDMVEHQFVSHTGSDGSGVAQRVSRTGYRWAVVGENLAMGQHTPEEVVQCWMDSPGHRRNILNDRFLEIGVAYIEGVIRSNGVIWRGGYWTQNFGTYLLETQLRPRAIKRIQQALLSLVRPQEEELEIVILAEEKCTSQTNSVTRQG